jgi:hypothetical protein
VWCRCSCAYTRGRWRSLPPETCRLEQSRRTCCRCWCAVARSGPPPRHRSGRLSTSDAASPKRVALRDQPTAHARVGQPIHSLAGKGWVSHTGRAPNRGSAKSRDRRRDGPGGRFAWRRSGAPSHVPGARGCRAWAKAFRAEPARTPPTTRSTSRRRPSLDRSSHFPHRPPFRRARRPLSMAYRPQPDERAERLLAHCQHWTPRIPRRNAPRSSSPRRRAAQVRLLGRSDAG